MEMLPLQLMEIGTRVCITDDMMILGHGAQSGRVISRFFHNDTLIWYTVLLENGVVCYAKPMEIIEDDDTETEFVSQDRRTYDSDGD